MLITPLDLERALREPLNQHFGPQLPKARLSTMLEGLNVFTRRQRKLASEDARRKCIARD
jgi:hypothetical protein